MKQKQKKHDTISQLKKEEDKTKSKKAKEEEEELSDEEEEEKNQNVVKEQTVQKSDKPKNLKELMGSMGDTKPKQKAKVTKPQKKNKSDEPGKLTFINTRGTANADKIDNEIRNKNKKLEFKNAGGLDSAAKANENIKHTKDYLEKDIKKKYKEIDEDVAKPQFITNKEDGENFVELNKNEDVRKIILIFFYL